MLCKPPRVRYSGTWRRRAGERPNPLDGLQLSMKFWISFAVVATIVNVALVFFGRGSFLHSVIAISLIVWVALPAFAVAVLCVLLRKRGPGFRRTARWTAGIGVIASSCLISLPIGSALLRHDIATARAFCESLVPKIEAYRAHHGKYPRDIRAVAGSGATPRLLEAPGYYGSNGESYSFFFEDPSGMMNSFSYDSATKTWSRAD